jgi:hypothetical protein
MNSENRVAETRGAFLDLKGDIIISQQALKCLKDRHGARSSYPTSDHPHNYKLYFISLTNYDKISSIVCIYM